MSDRQTGSVWTHYDGSVLSGPLLDSGAKLTIAPLFLTSWEEWQTLHPDTLVLDWYPEHAASYERMASRFGRAGLGSQFQESLLNFDERLPINELVLGVNVTNVYRAYPLSDSPSLSVIEDSLNGVPIVIFMDGENQSALAYRAQVDGERRRFSIANEQIVDDTGTVWEVDGRATQGPLAGTVLEFVTSFITEWYGWAAYHPETSIYGRDS